MVNQSENNQAQKSANLKKLVEDIALKHAFINIQDIKALLNEAGIPFKAESVKKYLYLLVKEGRLYSAGRGWYSILARSFPLDTQSIETFIGKVRKQFPLLVFCCWSAAQVQSWFHHLPAKTPLFVFVERDAQIGRAHV